MKNRLIKIIALCLCFSLVFEQSGFAQVAGQLDISSHLLSLRNSLVQEKFRPLHLRYLSYDNFNNNFRLLLDKGDFIKGLSPSELSRSNLKGTVPKERLEQETQTLLNYFFVGISLPNDSLWVNLRPDSPDNIIDDFLAQTDVGKILLEADLQLKKDTAQFTSPQTPEGKKYWDKLYQKAGELLGQENITIPTLVRPWIVPDEIIIRETPENAYVYKATLKVMLEEDYLKGSTTYNFTDPRLKALNQYSSQLLKERIIPKLTREVNTSKRYAPLRQVYYSLILAQWFKARFYGKGGLYSWLIDKRNLTGLISQGNWSKTQYFKEYQRSFKDGEYNLKEPIQTPHGQSVRSYMSGGINLVPSETPYPSRPPSVSSPVITSGPYTAMYTTKTEPGGSYLLAAKADFSGASAASPIEGKVEINLTAASSPLDEPDKPGASSPMAEQPPSASSPAVLGSRFNGQHGWVSNPEYLSWLRETKELIRTKIGPAMPVRVYYYGMGGGRSSNTGGVEPIDVISPLLATDFDQLYSYDYAEAVNLPVFKVVLNRQLRDLGIQDSDVHLEKKGNVFKFGFPYEGRQRTVIVTYGKDAKNEFPLELLSGFEVMYSRGIPVVFRDMQAATKAALLEQLKKQEGFLVMESLIDAPTTIEGFRRIDMGDTSWAGEARRLDVFQAIGTFASSIESASSPAKSTPASVSSLPGDENNLLKEAMKKILREETRGFENDRVYLEMYRHTRSIEDLTDPGYRFVSGRLYHATNLNDLLGILEKQEIEPRDSLTGKGAFVSQPILGRALREFTPEFHDDDSDEYIAVALEFPVEAVAGLTPNYAIPHPEDIENRAWWNFSEGIKLSGAQKMRVIVQDPFKVEEAKRQLQAKGFNVEVISSGDLENEILLHVKALRQFGIGSASSPAQTTSDKGGIDFRALPINTQTINPISNLRDSPLPVSGNSLRRGQSLSNVNLVTEWSQIQNMLHSGIIPSSERIKEYLEACSVKEDMDKEIDRVLACIADILRLEEERCQITEAGLKELLVLLESDKPIKDMQRALINITILPKETAIKP